jgi:hypothetical protein
MSRVLIEIFDETDIFSCKISSKILSKDVYNVFIDVLRPLYIECVLPKHINSLVHLNVKMIHVT